MTMQASSIPAKPRLVFFGALALAGLAAAGCPPGEGGGEGGAGGDVGTGGMATVGSGGQGGDAGGPVGGGGGAGGGVDCSAPQTIHISSSFGDVEHCGQFFIPLNNDSESSSIQIFSMGMETLAIENDGDDAVTVSVAITPQDGMKDEEFQLREDSTAYPPTTIENQTIDAGGSLSFNVMFFPVAGLERYADLTITYDDGSVYQITLKGRGHPADDPDTAILSEPLEPSWEKLFGGFGASEDEHPSGIAADASGNIFFAGATTSAMAIDTFYSDLLFGRIDADGTLAWHRLWASSAKDYMPDSGENGQSGSPRAVVTDPNGDVYVVGAVGIGENATNRHASLIMKLDGATGDPVWESYWHPRWDRVLNQAFVDSALPYALDYNDGRLYVTGQYTTIDDGGSLTTDNGGLFVIAVDAATGSLVWQKHIEPGPGNLTVDRGYAVEAMGTAGSESVVVGGWTGESGFNNTFMAKLDLSGTNATLAWQKSYDFHYGARINGLDADVAGDLYATIDNADYSATFMKVDGATGDVVWAKEIDGVGSGGPEVTADAIHVDGADVYVGGIFKVTWYDTQMGDAWLAKVAANDGSPELMGFYFNGKGAATVCSHKIKGIAVSDGHLYLGGSVYTGNANYDRYWGYWYQGTRGLVDVNLTADPQSDTQLEDIALGGIYTLAELQAQPTPNNAGNITSRHFGEQVTDWPTDPDAPRPLEWQDAAAKNESTHGAATDKDLMFWKIPMP